MRVKFVGEKSSDTTVTYQGAEYVVSAYCREYAHFFHAMPIGSHISISGIIKTGGRIEEAILHFIDSNAIAAIINGCDSRIVEKRGMEEILTCCDDMDTRERLVGQSFSLFLEARRKYEASRILFSAPTALHPTGTPLVVYSSHSRLYKDTPFYRLERLLYAVDSAYRDHMFHVYTVYCAGSLFLSRLAERLSIDQLEMLLHITPEHRETVKLYAYRESNTPIEGIRRLGAMWGYAALFHDIGYIVERISVEKLGGLAPLFEGVINLNRLDRRRLPLSKHALKSPLPDGSGQVDLAVGIARMHALLRGKSGTVWEISEPGDYRWRRVRPTRGLARLLRSLMNSDSRSVTRRDHGVASAAVAFKLLAQSIWHWCNLDYAQSPLVPRDLEPKERWRIYRRHVLEQDILRACEAIAMHNLKPRLSAEYGKVAHEIFPVRMSEHPLAFTLILCDELFDWWRPRDISQAFSGAGIGWNVYWEENHNIVFVLDMRYMDPILLADLLRTIAASDHLPEKSLRGKIDVELVQLLTGKDLDGHDAKYPAKLSRGSAEFEIRVDVHFPLAPVSKVALSDAYEEIENVDEILAALKPPSDNELLKLCQRWVHPGITPTSPGVTVSFLIP